MKHVPPCLAPSVERMGDMRGAPIRGTPKSPNGGFRIVEHRTLCMFYVALCGSSDVACNVRAHVNAIVMANYAHMGSKPSVAFDLLPPTYMALENSKHAE